MSAPRLPSALADLTERRNQPPVARAVSDARRKPRIARAVSDVRAILAPHRRVGRRIGLVPTMGALHDGHLSLVEAARRECDVVVVSIFVNPKQFDEQADLAAYPRQEPLDFELAARAGADILFVPEPDEIYRAGFQTTVQVEGLSESFEGAVRGAAHFRAVTTVCAKLFNIVSPAVAYFGQKDAQQAAVIGRMVGDLDIDMQVRTLPTVRERDGLAMSSRNVRLAAHDRERALALFAALCASQELAASGESAPERLLAAAAQRLAASNVDPDYVALVDPDTFAPLARLEDRGLLLVAARVGGVRLVDNMTLLAPRPVGQEEEPSTTWARRQLPGEAAAACSA